MKLRFSRTAGLGALMLLLWPAEAPAPIPDGVIVLPFEGEIIDLEDFSDCEFVNAGGFDVELCMDVEMEGDGRGKYAGMAELEFDFDIEGTLDGPASGSVKCSTDGGDSDGKASFGFDVAGQLDALGYTFDPSEVKVKCNGPVLPGGFFTSQCNVRVRVCLAGQCAGAGAKAVFDDDLGIGTWTLTLDADPIDEKKFGGTATDDLGNVYDVKGTYKDKTDTSKASVKGQKDTASKGAKVVLKELTALGAMAKFKVNGCKGDEEVAAD